MIMEKKFVANKALLVNQYVGLWGVGVDVQNQDIIGDTSDIFENYQKRYVGTST